MGFHDVRFPTAISWGSAGGPGFGNIILRGDDAQPTVIQRRQTALRGWDIRNNVKTDNQWAEIRDFVIARDGAANTFRFQDWLDFNTTPNGRTAVDTLEPQHRVSIGALDGTDADITFQLAKTYSSGGISRVRPIVLPIAETITIYLNSSPYPIPSGNVALDTNTGIVTVMAALNGSGTAGHDVSWSGEFDCHARFGDELDERLVVASTTALRLDVESIPVLEEPAPDVLMSEERHMGGYFETPSFGAEGYTLNASKGFFQEVNPALGANPPVYLPAESSLTQVGGGPFFYLRNKHGSNSFTLRTSSDEFVATFLSGEAGLVFIGIDSGGTYKVSVSRV